MTRSVTIDLSDEELDIITMIRSGNSREMSVADAISYAIRSYICDGCGRPVFKQCYICDNDE